MKFEVFCGKCKKHVYNMNLESQTSSINEASFEDVGHGIVKNGDPMICPACKENFKGFEIKNDQPGMVFLN